MSDGIAGRAAILQAARGPRTQLRVERFTDGDGRTAEERMDKWLQERRDRGDLALLALHPGTCRTAEGDGVHCLTLMYQEAQK